MRRKRVTISVNLNDIDFFGMNDVMKRFYLLYSTSHVVNNGFLEKCRSIPAFDAHTFYTSHTFMKRVDLWLNKGEPLCAWIAKNWTHFSPNIQERIEVCYPVRDNRTRTGYRMVTTLL